MSKSKSKSKKVKAQEAALIVAQENRFVNYKDVLYVADSSLSLFGWRPASEDDIQTQLLFTEAGDNGELVATQSRSWQDNFFELVKRYTRVPSDVAVPCLIDFGDRNGSTHGTPLGMIPCQDGGLELVKGEGGITETKFTPWHEVACDHRALIFNPTPLNVTWEARGETEDKTVWEFLVEATDSPEQARIILRWFGTSITIGTALEENWEHALWLIGHAGCGKGSFLEAVQHICGTGHTASSFFSVGGNFGLNAFRGKRVACFPDEDDVSRYTK